MVFKIKNLKYGLPVLLIILLIIFVKVHNSGATCTITPATIKTSNVDDSTVNFSWTNGQNGKITYLNVSTSQSLKPDGSLETPDIVNDVVTDQNSYSKSNLSPGTYYWNIVIDGCRQRKVSSLGTFTVQPTVNADCKATPAILGTPVIQDSKVTLSWTSNRSVGATYINVSTSKEVNADGILQKVDIANDAVTGKTSFTKENLSPDTYYWNIASDGCNQRKMSELGTFTIQSSSE